MYSGAATKNVHSALATHDQVVESVLGSTDAKGKKVLLPAHDFAWAIASTADSSSRMHVDAEGLATASVMVNEEGMKYWFVGRPKVKGTVVRASETRSFGKFDDELLDPDWRYEGVLLTYGTCL